MSKKYHVTFGVQYSHQPHPRYDWVDPNGYVTFEVPECVSPHDLAHVLFGEHYAFIYPDDAHVMNPEFYPLGCIRWFDAAGSATN